MKTIFLIALKAIWTNKVRSFLTMLGVIIGVGSVVMLIAIGDGLRAFVTNEFEQLGTNTVIVFPGDIFGENGGFDQESQISAFANSKLTLRDVEDLKTVREFVTDVVPLYTITDKAEYKTESKRVSVVGTTYNFQLTQGNIVTDKGRFFNRSEDDRGERVVVLGFSVTEELFGNVDPIGKKIKIGGQTYEVIGTTEEVGGGFGGPSFDTYIYVPIKTAFRQYDTNIVIEMDVKIRDANEIDAAIDAIEKKLLEKYEDDEFSVFDQAQILDTINQILGALTVGLGGIAAISLVVGGIGIMNIMLVSVTERTREIGLRKALGATPAVILWQFMIEAALLSVVGGMIGVAIAFMGTLAIQAFVPATITMQAVLLAFGVSTVVGLVFGAAPARRAAKLSPIEALRYE